MSKSFLTIIALSLVLFSCGEQNSEETPDVVGNNNPYNWLEPLKASSQLGEDELAIAKRVCQSFQKKRAFLARQAQGLVLDYRVSEKVCGQEDPSVERGQGRMMMNRDGNLSLSNLNPSTPIFTDVLSDQHSKIEPFCDQVLAGINPQNTRTVAPFRHQISFFTEVERDWIQIVEFQSRNGTFYPFIIERSSIVTPTTTDNQDQHGFVSIRAVNRPCSDFSNQFIMQEWL